MGTALRMKMSADLVSKYNEQRYPVCALFRLKAADGYRVFDVMPFTNRTSRITFVKDWCEVGIERWIMVVAHFSDNAKVIAETPPNTGIGGACATLHRIIPADMTAEEMLDDLNGDRPR